MHCDQRSSLLQVVQLQAKEKDLAQEQQQLRQQVHECTNETEYPVTAYLYIGSLEQMTEKDELVQAKDRELAQTQQKLRQQVSL